jgi:hypothetical protein
MEQTSNVDGAAGYVPHPQSHPRKAEDYGLRDSLAEAVMARSRGRYRVDSRGAITPIQAGYRSRKLWERLTRLRSFVQSRAPHRRPYTGR